MCATKDKKNETKCGDFLLQNNSIVLCDSYKCDARKGF